MVQAAIKKSLNLGMKRPPNFSGKTIAQGEKRNDKDSILETAVEREKAV